MTWNAVSRQSATVCWSDQVRDAGARRLYPQHGSFERTTTCNSKKLQTPTMPMLTVRYGLRAKPCYHAPCLGLGLEDLAGKGVE